MNFYGYVFDNPTNLIDPFGLVPPGGWGKPKNPFPAPITCIFPFCFYYYGNWGGPGWTGGQWKPYEDVDPSTLAPPIDEQDECYMYHDICYSKERVKGKQCGGSGSGDTGHCDIELMMCLQGINGGNGPGKNARSKAAQPWFSIQELIF